MKMIGAQNKFTSLLLAVALLAVFNGFAVQARTQAAEFACTAQTSIPVDQCEALVAIYTATGGAEWTIADGWLEDANPCQWHGVSCSEGNVVALDLYSNNLTGSLPLEIGGFPNLKTLTINGNPLSGPVPLTISFMDLDLFHFHNTSLCEPSDPNFQDWLLQIVYRLSSGIYCTPLQPSATQISAQTQEVGSLPWPQQTLTALANENSSSIGIATQEATPTKYYNLETATPTAIQEVAAPADGSALGQADGDLQAAQEGPSFFENIPRGWLIVLTIPLFLIIVGVFLEIRDRKKEQEERRPSKLEWGDIEEQK